MNYLIAYVFVVFVQVELVALERRLSVKNKKEKNTYAGMSKGNAGIR